LQKLLATFYGYHGVTNEQTETLLHYYIFHGFTEKSLTKIKDENEQVNPYHHQQEVQYFLLLAMVLL